MTKWMQLSGLPIDGLEFANSSLKIRAILDPLDGPEDKIWGVKLLYSLPSAPGKRIHTMVCGETARVNFALGDAEVTLQTVIEDDYQTALFVMFKSGAVNNAVFVYRAPTEKALLQVLEDLAALAEDMPQARTFIEQIKKARDPLLRAH